jgi:hypothetical protein
MGIFSRDWLRRWVIPSGGRDDPKLDEIKRAAAANVEEVQEEDEKYFRPGSPEDDL